MTQRLRSYSFAKKNQDNGLAKENSQLKDRVHQMKFLVEDNLDVLINELDEDFKQQAVISDLSTVFSVIKSNVDRWKIQITCQKDNIKILENQFEKVKENEYNIKKWAENEIKNVKDYHQISQNEKDNQITELNSQISNLQILLQNCQEKLLEQTSYTDQKLQQHQSQLRQKITSLENDIQQLKQQQQFELQAMLHNHEKDRKFLKEEIDNATSAVEQKYKKYYLENQSLAEKMSKSAQQVKQLKQQKESLERQIEQQNLKVKQHIEDLANERKLRAKDVKLQTELQDQILAFQNKFLLEEKRQFRLKEQITSQEDQMQVLLKQHNSNVNQLNQDIYNLKQEIIEKNKQLSVQQSNFEQQLQIQRVKYELQLGNSISSDDQQYQRVNFSQQYDDQVQIDYVKDLVSQIKEQQQGIIEQKQTIADWIVKYQKLQLSLAQQIEQKVKELQYEHKQLSNKQLSDFENQREKMTIEQNCKITMLQQQLSHETDKLRCEIKDNLMKIDSLNNSIQEKDQTLEYVAEQLQLSKENNYNEKKRSEQELVNLHNQHQTEIESQSKMYNIKINELQSQLSSQACSSEQLNQQYQQLLKSNQETRTELRDQKQLNQQYRVQQDKLSKELQIQYDLAKSLNDRIRQMHVEVENAKSTYNIFTKTQRIPIVMSSEIKLTKLRTSPMNRRLRSISNTRLQQLQNL